MFMGVPTRNLLVHATLPAWFTVPRYNRWGEIKGGANRRELGCFLEGPAFDALGALYVVDIPFGRIFRLAPEGEWDLVVEYDGWPNGLKVRSDGKLLVADHKLGLVLVDPARSTWDVVLDNAGGEALLGLNDLTFGPDGCLYATDQGNTGLSDPRGRVLRIDADFRSEIVLDCGPSPNGLVFDRNGVLHVAMTRANAVWRVPFQEGRAHRVGLALQLSGGVGPDGLAVDAAGNLLVAHPPLGVWRFDHDGVPLEIYRLPGSLTTNIAVRRVGTREQIFVTDSVGGRILTAELGDHGT